MLLFENYINFEISRLIMNSKINSEFPKNHYTFVEIPTLYFFFLGKFISQMGDAVYNMVVGWYILSITKSA